MKSIFDIAGRVAIVIGGTSGIGRALTLGFAQAGAHTVAAGRRRVLVDQVADEIELLGVRTVRQACDISNRNSIDDLRATVIEKLGGIDILVNCAGVTFRKPTIQIEMDEWNSLIQTNLTGMLAACQSFYEPLSQSSSGRIINIASLASHRAFHEVAAYAASKAAVLSLTQSLGCEWAKAGIRTNAIVPGVFVTDINRHLLAGTRRGEELLMRTPLSRFGDVAELVGAAIFLASDAVSFITGTTLTVDGGFLAAGVNC